MAPILLVHIRKKNTRVVGWLCLHIGLLICLGATPCFAQDTSNNFASIFLDIPNDSDVSTICTRTQAIPSADPEKLNLRQTFEDNFKTFDIRFGPWETHFEGDSKSLKKRTLQGNGEQEIYVDEDFRGTTSAPLRVNPFTDNGRFLRITARRLPSQLRAPLYNYQYASGLITSWHSLSQTYGYFEINAKLPAGYAMWPGFWLLPENKSWPPELDVVEAWGQNPEQVFMTVHWLEGGVHKATRCKFLVPSATAVFHRYGALWTPERIVFYIDREPVGELATPQGLNKPMYMLANLAVGGKQIGLVDDRTPDSADFDIKEISAFAWSRE